MEADNPGSFGSVKTLMVVAMMVVVKNSCLHYSLLIVWFTCQVFLMFAVINRP